MTGTANGLAVRETASPAALAIQAGQTAFDKMQLAALRQLGLDEASEGDLAVFLHQAQRTGLDPFARQIYMIGRNEKVPGSQNQWRKKYSIQTGIDGLRVMRARAEAKAGIRGILSRPVYYDAEGGEHKVWFQRLPPVAVEMTYTVRDASGDTPYTSILRFTEYAQYKEEKLTGQWATKGVHMLEKCTEADVYRKAFPQDFSGVQLDDAMPAPDPDAVPAQPQRPRVTAEQARARTQTVTAEVVTPEPSPAGTETPASAPPAPPVADAQPAGEAQPRLASPGQVGLIRKRFAELYPDEESDQDRWERLLQTAKLARTGTPLTTTKELTAEQAADVLVALQKVTSAKALEALIGSGEVPQ